METRTLAVELLHERADKKARTIPVVLSTETPVMRDFGAEILEHSVKAIDLARAPLPLIESHDHHQLNIGVVEHLRIVGNKLRGVVRFGTSDRAQEVFQDVLDRIVTSVSIAYEIIKFTNTSDGIYVDRWAPYEASAVSVPADPNAGFYRSLNMSNENHKSIESSASRSQLRAAEHRERERVTAIINVGKKHKEEELARRYVEEGRPVLEFNDAVLENMPLRTLQSNSAEIGLSEFEKGKFSFVKAIRAQAAKQLGDVSSRYVKEAGFEIECSRAASQKYKVEPQGILIPEDVLSTRSISKAQRDLQVGTATAGGNLVATELLGTSFIDLLRVNMITQQLGATMLEGLVGDVAIPKQTGAATAYWLAEGIAPTESQQTIGQVALTPKTLGAYTDYSRKLMLQGVLDIEHFVRSDLARIIAIELDRVALYGSGAGGEPTGIQNMAGLNTTSFSSSANPSWSEIVSMQTDVATDNALLGTLGYATHPAVRGNMMTTSRAGTEAIFVLNDDNRLAGFPVGISTQITATHVWFGNWAELLLGRWGGVDLLVDPYSNSTTGTMRIVIFQSCDVGVRHGESFSLGS